MKRKHLAALSAGLALSILCAGSASGASAANQWIADYGRLPLAFEANAGQTDGRVKFLSRGRGYTVFLTEDEAVLALPKVAHPTRMVKSATASVSHLERVAVPRPAPDSLLRMKLVGANLNAAVTGADELAGKSNYIKGNDPKKWRTNVPNYARVNYPGVYPGVDLVYYGNQSGQLEYDFVVAPGADPGPITLNVAADSVHPLKGERRKPLRIAADGDLLVKVGGGEIRFHKPIVYQIEPGGARPGAGTGRHLLREGRFVLVASNQVRFALGRYDHNKALIIDPVLSYSTYLGGSAPGGFTLGNAIAVDSSGNAYVVGSTTCSDFPTQSPVQPTYGPGGDAFITKLSPSGSALVYSTFLSGADFSGGTEGQSIAVDVSGAAYVTGITTSTDFPTVNPVQGSPGGVAGTQNAFITKLDPSGAALVYSTYYGGSAGINATAIAVDASGGAYVAGFVLGALPTVNALQPVYGGNVDAFVAKLNAAGSAFIYATYLGGSGDDQATSIAVDSGGNAYVAGSTVSTNFPTHAPFQAANATAVGTGFVAKINAAGSALVYSTYLGGSLFDIANAIAVDGSGDAYVAGETGSSDFPTKNPVQATNLAASGGGDNGFVAELNPAGSALVYSTYLGGSTSDTLKGIAVDSLGDTYVGGTTSSVDFPTVNPLPVVDGGLAANSTLAELSVGGGALVFSTHFGANSIGQTTTTGENSIEAIAVDPAGNLYVTGDTNSTIYPTLNALQATYPGETSAFVAKFGASSASAPTVTISAAPTTITVGQSATLTWSSTNATSCTASGAWSGAQATHGTHAESPTQSGSSTYTLTCSGAGGSAQASAQLTVSAAPPPAPTVTLSVEPTAIALGQSATLSWSSTNATSCTASGAWSGAQATHGTHAESPTQSGGSTYTLTCSGAGGSAQGSARLTVNAAPPPAPTVIFSVDPTSIALGQSATLSWSSTNATSCTASGAWSGTQKTSGTFKVTPSAAGTAAYNLSCSGAGNGASGTSVVKLTVSAPTAAVTELSGKAGGGGMGLWSLLGLGLLVAWRLRRSLSPAGFATLAVVAVFMVLVAGAPASAQDTATLQFKWDQSYVGIRVGSGSYWESSRQLDADIAANGETGTTTTSVDQHRAGGVVYAGVPFYRALSLELGFADLGTYPVAISTTSTNIPQLAQTIVRNLSPAGRAVTLNLAAPLDINPWFALEPRIGVFGYRSKQEVFTPIGTFSDERDGAGVDAGLALLLRPTRRIYIGAGIDCFETGGRCNVLLYSAQIEYHFGR